MTVIISGFGLRINLIASVTLPLGYTFTQFADDADPFDIPAIQTADVAMGANGDFLVWSKPTPIRLSIALVPNTPDDALMGVLLEANRAGQGKALANDRITLTGIYPDNRVVNMVDGAIIEGMPGNSLGSAGRLKSKVYTFAFGNRNGIGA